MIQSPGGLHALHTATQKKQQQPHNVISSAKFKVTGSLQSQLVQQNLLEHMLLASMSVHATVCKCLAESRCM